MTTAKEKSRPAQAAPRELAEVQRTLTVARRDLRAWRTARLGRVKQTPEYQSLPPIVRQLVDYLVRRHRVARRGITVAQGQEELLHRFSVTRQTMNGYFRAIEGAGVFVAEPRWRSQLGVRGARRTTNRYRVNDALLSAKATTPDTSTDVKPDSRRSTTYSLLKTPYGSQSEGSSSHAKVKTESSPPLNGIPTPNGAPAENPAGLTRDSSFAIPSRLERDEECSNCKTPFSNLSRGCTVCVERKRPAVAARDRALEAACLRGGTHDA